MQFIVVTYVLAVLWLMVFAFAALPVYFFYNMSATCHTIDILTETPASINQLCVDARQYGKKTSINVDWRLNCSYLQPISPVVTLLCHESMPLSINYIKKKC